MKHRSFAHHARAVALWAFCISAVFASLPACAQAPNPDGTGFAGAYAPSKSWQPPRDPQALAKLRKFQDLKFGFFYCWGTQTQWGTVDQSWCLCPERYDWNKRPAGHEHEDTLTFKKSYEALARTFNPVKFNPQALADLAEEAGTRYLVFVTKHHDGFCFWDTKTTDYKITSASCPFHTNANANVTRALFEAFRKKNFWIGAYFSKSDWNVPYYWAPQFGAPTSRDPNYSPNKHPEVWKQFKEFTWAQIRELMENYGSVDILWLDGGQVQPGSGQNIDMPGLARMARELQPGLLVVDRTVGGGYEDFLTPEGTQAMPRQFIPEPWEACMHLGDVWAWSQNSSYHSAGSIIRYLVRAAARNGNLLLAVGPDARGELDAQAVKVLKDIGAWLKLNGEAIYDTRPVKPYEHGNCFFTRKADGTLYAIVLGAKDGDSMPASVTLPAALAADGRSITLVGHRSAPLAVTVGTDGLAVVELPAAARANPPCSEAWALRIQPPKGN
jgi:alpha-L-fucosidase